MANRYNNSSRKTSYPSRRSTTASERSSTAPARSSTAPRKAAPKKPRNWWKPLLIVLASAAVLAGAAAGTYFLIRNQREKDALPPLVATYRGTEYSATASGLVFVSGSEITMKSNVAPDEELTYTITATAKAANFEYTVGEEPYSWAYLNDADFTDIFDLERTKSGVIIRFGSLTELISLAQGTEISVSDDFEVPKNIFVLKISGERSGTLELRFTISPPAEDVELDPPEIYL